MNGTFCSVNALLEPHVSHSPTGGRSPKPAEPGAAPGPDSRAVSVTALRSVHSAGRVNCVALVA